MTYDTIHDSVLYYEIQGYQYIQTPWIVKESVSNITKPVEKQNFPFRDKVLVASGEQSFLELIHNHQLDPGKHYQTTTPCFRDEVEDELHKLYFMKTELIYFEYIQNDCVNPEQIARLEKEVDLMAHGICAKFFSKYLPVKTINLPDQSKDHFHLYDIVTDDNDQIELGSYGVRRYNNIIWAYGTGCAEPRLSNIIKDHTKPGYHLSPIPKGELGTFDKIIEEYGELLDAVKQKTKLMTLVELSDLIGAIGFYVEKNYQMSLDDLLVFNKITQRAFINGGRSPHIPLKK